MSNTKAAGSDRKETCTSTQEGLKIIEVLQNFLVHQSEEIEGLNKKLKVLEDEKDALKAQVYSRNEMKWQNAATQTESTCNCDRKTSQSDITSQREKPPSEEVDCENSGHADALLKKDMETQEVEITIGDRVNTSTDAANENKPVARADEIDGKVMNGNKETTPLKPTNKETTTPQKARRSGSNVKRQNSKGRVDMSYQLSPDLQAVTVDLLANKYGGKEKANNAAKIIQEYYRHWVLSRSFKRMRAYSERRKKSITRYPENLLKMEKIPGHNSVYDIENPVLIVDLDDDDNKNDSAYLQTKDDSASLEIEVERAERSSSFLKTMSRAKVVADEKGPVGSDARKILLPSDSVFYQGKPKEAKVEKEVMLGSSKVNANVVQDGGKQENDQKEEVKGDEMARNLKRSESSDSYEIIDEQQFIHVISRNKSDQATESLSSISSDTIDETNESRDQSASIFYDDDHYPPTVDKSKKWRYRIGINLFNSKPEDGIEYLVDNELLQNTPKCIAEFLRKETSIAKHKISEYFGNFRKEMNRQALREFAFSFDFANKEIDEALRQFQSYFKLTGEAQSIERFLQVFSDRYVACNPDGISKSVDTILLLSYAMAMLNTDLHNGNVKRKMSVEDFIRNLRGTDDGKDFPQEMLQNIYNRIQRNEFSTGADHMTQLKQIEHSFIGKIPAIAEPHRQFVKLFTLEEVYDPNRRDKPHFRLAFLFNDLLVLAKPRSKPGPHGSGHFFSFKADYKLLGMQVAEFTNEHYKFGVYLQTKIDSKTIGRFNLRDEKTRKSFTDDLDDCIRETTGMNNIRIALSKSKQGTRSNYIGPQSMTLDRKKIKAKRGTAETLSLLSVDINSLEDDSLSKNRASSMLNISEAASDTESEPTMRRSNSSTSLDHSCMNTPPERRTMKKIRSVMKWMMPQPSTKRRSDSSNTVISETSKHSSLPRINESGQSSTTSHHRKLTLFRFTRRRKPSADNEAQNTRERRRDVGMSTFFHEIDDTVDYCV